jgi:hypothetical protein
MDLAANPCNASPQVGVGGFLSPETCLCRSQVVFRDQRLAAISSPLFFGLAGLPCRIKGYPAWLHMLGWVCSVVSVAKRFTFNS